MKLGQIVGTEYVSGPAEDIEITGITADSREVEPGFLFAALPGTRVDGAAFIPQALDNGAVALLVSADYAPDGDLPSVPLIRAAEPRQALARMAARFFGAQPNVAVAVTGTNGKTSVASFVRQIWQGAGRSAASIGTLGICTAEGTDALRYTTPDPVALHRILADLDRRGIDHVALEASSHGLAQHRMDGVLLKAGAFTNISRDHLDYHPDFEDYLVAKLRLFTELLEPGAAAIIDVDHPASERAADAARDRGLDVWTVGREGARLRLADVRPDGFGQRIGFEYDGQTFDVLLPLIGVFQAENAAVAAGLALATGCAPEVVFGALERIEGARGRLEYAGETETGGGIFIDYAHTPDALANALSAVRPFAKGKVAVVFGCGGDRDRGKRPEMGAIAQQLADRIYVTDDNPRTEDPAMIRGEILAAAPGAVEIADRTQAISQAVSVLESGDILLVAGKGHETGQIVGDRIMPFSDHEAVRAALIAAGRRHRAVHG